MLFPFTGWADPLTQVFEEVKQRKQEGYLVPEWVEEELRWIGRESSRFDFEALRRFEAALGRLERDPAFPFEEPSDLPRIRKARPEGPRRLPLALKEDEMRERFHGAWTARAFGCALGKPVEGLGMWGGQGLSGRLAIKRFLENRGEWPLRDYFDPGGVKDGIAIGCPESQRGKIAYMEPDDDIHYTLIALAVLEKKGADFTWQDVAQMWNASLPYSAICTAEAQAIMNYNIVTPRHFRGPTPATPEFTSTHNNPYREWIGAQIRADGWGYAAAGNPELAAEFAFRDAHWTHRKNGIYGEMFVAALIAAAFVEKDPVKLIGIGLSEIPSNCRLAAALRDALSWFRECRDFEAFMERLEEKYGHYNPVHTVNNALIVAMSLYYGEMDPAASACLAVMGGLDTDCNGATAGSIAGAAFGRKALDAPLARPLHDTIKPLVFGFQEITITELAERTYKVWKRIGEN